MKASEEASRRSVSACVTTLTAAADEIERLRPDELAALARAASRFVRAAKRLRRQRTQLCRPRIVEPPPRGVAAPAPARAHTAARAAVGRASTGRSLAQPPPQPSPRLPPAGARSSPRRCYACGARLGERQAPESLCPPCAALNEAKRHQQADLSGRVMIVTGARVGAGHEAALKLLRAGATVIGTTRFPRDAAARFGALRDFSSWSGRLHLYGLDARSPALVEAFADDVLASFHRLDALINNAAQTVRRPAPFYAHLVPAEQAPLRQIDARLRPVLAAGERFAQQRAGAPRGAPWAAAALLSQVPLLPEDTAALVGGLLLGSGGPEPIDARQANSWTLSLGEVPTAEGLEALVVNALAPFVLAGRLRPRMASAALRDKWVINVTAAEGQFSQQRKSGHHPHANMAKAALNMMTRTCADDFARDRIFMNSVDTGWFSHAEPALAAARMQQRGFRLPLDAIDAAARICDPIFTGVLIGHTPHGQLIKNYRPIPW